MRRLLLLTGKFLSADTPTDLDAEGGVGAEPISGGYSTDHSGAVGERDEALVPLAEGWVDVLAENWVDVAR